MAMKKIKELREDAEAALAAGVANRAQLMDAVPALVALQNAERSLQLRLKETTAVIRALSEACSKYAHEHREYVFDKTFSVSPIGVESGDIVVDGRTFHFSHGFDGYDHADPAQKKTQEFLASLPKGWTKAKIELNTVGINRANPTDEELAKHSLVRKVKEVWTEIL